MGFENEQMSPACFPNSSLSRNLARAKSPFKVARKPGLVTEKIMSGTLGQAQGRRGKNGA